MLYTEDMTASRLRKSRKPSVRRTLSIPAEEDLLPREITLIKNYVVHDMPMAEALKVGGFTSRAVLNKPRVKLSIQTGTRARYDELSRSFAWAVNFLAKVAEKAYKGEGYRNGEPNLEAAIEAIHKINLMYKVYDTKPNIKNQVNINNNLGVDDKMRMRKEYQIPAKWILPEEKKK